MNIRKAGPQDAEALRELYLEHLTDHPPAEPQDMDLWRGMLGRFLADGHYNILVCEQDGRAVSSVTLVVVDNLTHNARPYAIVENVVTHAGHRNRGCASALMERAEQIARGFGCYKIMLLTGSKRQSTLRFYENCGFNGGDKTAFIKWL